MKAYFPLKQWIYAKRPTGRVGNENYQLVESNWSPTLAKNEVLIEAKHFSVDPYMRIQQHQTSNWEEPHPLDAVQGGAVVGQVIQSNSDKFQQHDWVWAYSGWQTHAVMHENEIEKLDPAQADVTSALGVLGMPGRTAWFGLMEVGKPKAGEVVVVSGAAGAVGSLVVQFAVKNGCQVIAIAGSDEKCSWLKSLGAVATINYKKYRDAQEIKNKISAVSTGVDVYYDNVGGTITDAVIDCLNVRARVVVCGQISQYDGHLDQPQLGPRFLHNILYKRATIEGVLARDYTHRMQEMIDHVSPWYRAGELEFKTTITHGFEQLPDALGGLFDGKNTGKAIVTV